MLLVIYPINESLRDQRGRKGGSSTVSSHGGKGIKKWPILVHVFNGRLLSVFRTKIVFIVTQINLEKVPLM